MLAQLEGKDLSSLRTCVSAGEHLPAATWHTWKEATGISIVDGIGATEMMHIFISASGDDIRPGATGKAVPGYRACVLGDDGEALAHGTGRLAVKGPTGCRYFDDERQSNYVENGWNVTGDTYRQDEDGYFWYLARSDDMIISSGLQHRRAGGGERASRASCRAGMRGHRNPVRRAGAARQSLHRRGPRSSPCDALAEELKTT
jgi:2-aminobenzoate-CoA ligase